MISSGKFITFICNNHFLIVHSGKMLLKNPLSTDLPGKTIRKTTLTGNANGKPSFALPHSANLLERRLKIGQMLQDMYGQIPVEMGIFEWQLFLTIAHKKLDAGNLSLIVAAISERNSTQTYCSQQAVHTEGLARPAHLENATFA